MVKFGKQHPKMKQLPPDEGIDDLVPDDAVLQFGDGTFTAKDKSFIRAGIDALFCNLGKPLHKALGILRHKMGKD